MCRRSSSNSHQLDAVDAQLVAQRCSHFSRQGISLRLDEDDLSLQVESKEK